MQHGQITLEHDKTARFLGWGVRFFLTAALTAGKLPDGQAPFALGCMAAAGAGADGLAALAGAAAGAVLFLPFADALPQMAEAILILTAATAFRGTALEARPQVLPLTATGIALSVGGIYVAQSLSPLARLPQCLAAAVVTGLSGWFFRPLLRPGVEEDLSGSLLFLAAAVLTSLSEVEWMGLSGGRVFAGTLLLYTASQRGGTVGAAAGLGLGLLTDLRAGTGGCLFAAVYGLQGLLCGGLHSRRRVRTALCAMAASLAALLSAEFRWCGILLTESALSAGLYLLLPGKLFGGKRVRREEPSGTTAGELLRRRLNKAAGALRELYDSMGRSPAAEENPAIIFDRAAEKVCRDCALAQLCWQSEYTGTFNALNDATPYLLERGRAMAKDFPDYFASRCIHLTDFLTAVNGELSAFLLRRQYRRQLEETRRSARGQYAQLSDLLTATAAGLETGDRASDREPPCRIGAVIRPKEGERACGDTLVSFRKEDGVWCLLLSDGMGSGEAARKESALTCRLLRQFLEAGIEPEAALQTLNGAMALRGAETGSFTTIDLCTVDPQSGETCFYKYGAAPSYVKKGGVVRRITGASLPVGLRGTPADVTRVQLEPDSFVVQVSDGVSDALRDEWLQNLLAGWEDRDPQTLAAAVLEESIRRERLQDDCGIQIFYCGTAQDQNLV